MTNAHTAPRMAAGKPARRRGGVEATSSPSPPTRRRSRGSASTPPTCSVSGIGSAVAIRWTRPTVCRRCSRSAATCSPKMLAGFHAMDEHFRTGSGGRQHAGAAGAVDPSGTPKLLRRPDCRGARYDPYLKRFPRLPAATAHDGVQRQVGHAGRPPRRLRHGSRVLGRAAGTNGQHSFYQSDPSGDASDPVRLHRLRARSTRSATTTTC